MSRRLLLGTANIHTNLESLIGPVISPITVTARWSSLTWRYGAHAFPSLVQRWLREHLLLRGVGSGLLEGGVY